jgi:hypothetical protein
MMKRRIQRKLIQRESRALSAATGAPVGDLRTLSEMIGRAQLAALAGKSFHGKRDMYQSLGYDRDVDVVKYRARYKRSGIAKRIVEAGPKATWRGGAEIIEDENPEVSTEFEEVFVDLDDRLHVWATLCRLDILAGIGRYAVLLIGAPGELSTEMSPTVSADEIVYLQPYGEDDAVIKTWDTDPKSARFGFPTSYTLTRTNTAGTLNVTLNDVHWTRVIHVANDILDETVYGQPRLECVWNYLDDLDKVVGGGSEAFWMRVNKGLALQLDPETDFSATSPEGLARQKALKHELDDYEHKLKRIIALQGVEIKELGGDVANFAAQVDSLLTLIAASTGIPKRILQGSERGELASTQDATNWDTQIEDRRDQFAKPYVLAPFIDFCVEHGVLPEPEKWEVKWPSLVQLDEQGKADLAMKYKNLGQTIVTDAEIRNDVLGKEQLTEEQKAEIAASQPQPPVMPADETAVGVVEPGRKKGAPPKAMTEAEKQLEADRLKEELRTAASRKPSLAQLRIDSVAKKHEASMTGRLLSAIKRVKRALSQKLLTYAVGTGHQGTVESEVSKAFGELERVAAQPLAKELKKTMIAGGDAAARSIHLHGVPLKARNAGGPGSGYFGHGGRPGEVGGSSGEGESSVSSSGSSSVSSSVSRSKLEPLSLSMQWSSSQEGGSGEVTINLPKGMDAKKMTDDEAARVLLHRLPGESAARYVDSKDDIDSIKAKVTGHGDGWVNVSFDLTLSDSGLSKMLGEDDESASEVQSQRGNLTTDVRLRD